MAQLHPLGTGNFTLSGGVHETRFLSQLNYNKSNCVIQTRKIKQEQQATEVADIRNKAATTKKEKSKDPLSLTHKRLDQLENKKKKPTQFASGFKVINQMITSDPFSE